MTPRHFLDLDQFDTATLRRILDLGKSYKKGVKVHGDRPLQGKLLAMIFEKHSTRTRVSFEAGMRRLGGEVTVLGSNDTRVRVEGFSKIIASVLPASGRPWPPFARAFFIALP